MRLLLQLAYSFAFLGCICVAGLGLVLTGSWIAGSAFNSAAGPWGLVAVAAGIGGLYLTERAALTLPIRTRHGRRFRLQGSLEDVRAQVDALAKRDESAEAGLSQAGRSAAWGCLGLALATATAIGGQAAGGPWADVGLWVGGAFGAVTLLLWLHALALKLWHGRHDLDDPKIAALDHILTLLSPDVPARGTLALDVAMGTPDFSVRKTQGFGRLLEAWEDRWLRLRTRLADGTSLRLSLRAGARRRVKFKRKRKRTSVRVGKATLSWEATFLLRVNPNRYPNLADLEKALAGGIGFQRPQVKELQVTADTIRMTVADYFYPDTGKGILNPLVWVYRGLHRLQKKGGQADPGPAGGD